MRRLRFLLAITAIMFGGLNANGSDWITVGGGDWATSSNWSGGAVPNASEAVANFSGVNPASAATVTIGAGATQTVGTLQFGSSGAKNVWTVSGGTLTINNGANNGAITVNSGSTATVSSALTATGTINLSGGGTLQVSDASGAKGWSITGATLEDTAPTPGKLGSGTITLNEGAVLKSSGSVRRTYSNAVVINGECTLFSQGLALSGTLSGSGLIHKQGGWDMTISGNNTDLSADWSLEADYTRFNNANAGGTGAVHYKGGALLGYNNGTISNNLSIDSNVANYLVGGVNSITLTGDITGSKNITLCSNQYQAANILNLQGDASAYTGNWLINETYVATGQTEYRYNPITVTTNNSSNVKVNGGDSRFGQGSVTIRRGVLQAAAAKTYVHNAITLSGAQTTPQLSFEGKVLTLTGGLSGDSDITLNYTTTASTTANRLRLLDGNNSNFSGDWHVKNVLLVTNAGNTQNKAFGSGTIYLEGGAGIVGWSSRSTASTHDSTRADAYVYNNIVNSGVNFFRSDGDTIEGTTTVPNFQITVSGAISGNGLLVRQGGGYKFSPRGNNSQYKGDWMIRSDYAETNNTASTTGNDAATHTDVRFGSGTIYLTDGAGLQGGNGAAVFADITVNSGKTGNFRNGNPNFYGTITADGTFASTNTVNMFGTVQGRGTVAFATVMKDGSVIAPGIEGVYQYDANYIKSAVTDQTVGTLTFSKGLTLETGSVLDIDVASPESFDKINLAGSPSAELDLSKTSVVINLLDSFDMSYLNDHSILTLDFVENATITQSPTDVQIKYTEEKLFAETFYGAALVFSASGSAPGEISVRLSYDQNLVPEPATWTLLLIGLGVGFVQYRRRKR